MTRSVLRRRPLTVTALVLIWLLLTQSVAPANLVLALALAWFWARMLDRLEFPEMKLRRPRAALALAAHVVRDVVRSNLAVGWIIARPNARRRRAAFMDIPLDVTHPVALAVLAGIVTATPGTLWVDVDADGRSMRLHVLDLVDEAAWTRKIKGDYESLLREVFE